MARQRRRGMSKLVTGKEEQVWRGRAPAHGEQLTPGQTSPRSSGNSSPPHHCCPRMCYPDPFLGTTHTLVSAEEITGTPPPSATSHPCCLSVAQAPLSSARPHLWLLTARSGWQQQRPDARTCSEKGQAGGQVRCGRTYWSIGRTPPLISPIPTLPNLAYLLSDCHFYQHLTRPSHQEISVFSQLHWKFQLQASVQALGMRMGERMFGNN